MAFLLVLLVVHGAREGRHLKVRVFYHDKCFDGTASASLFSRFYRERVRSDAQFQFSGLVHRAGSLFNEDDFDGDENAIVDFKYSPSPKITWWFDHHQSAFLTPEDAEHFRNGDKTRKFYHPAFPPCTNLLPPPPPPPPASPPNPLPHPPPPPPLPPPPPPNPPPPPP